MLATSCSPNVQGRAICVECHTLIFNNSDSYWDDISLPALPLMDFPFVEWLTDYPLSVQQPPLCVFLPFSFRNRSSSSPGSLFPESGKSLAVGAHAAA